MRPWYPNTKSTCRPGGLSPGSSDRSSRLVHTVSQPTEPPRQATLLNLNVYLHSQNASSTVHLLHCALRLAVQCIVIGPVCGFVAVFVCMCLCGSLNTITQNCVHQFSPNWVYRWSSDHLQLIKFWPSCAPGKGGCSRAKFFALPYYSQRAVFASLWALFSFSSLFF